MRAVWVRSGGGRLGEQLEQAAPAAAPGDPVTQRLAVDQSLQISVLQGDGSVKVRKARSTAARAAVGQLPDGAWVSCQQLEDGSAGRVAEQAQSRDSVSVH
jgi:hypothetical protein